MHWSVCCTVVQNTHDQIMSDGRSNASYQIAFCAFHSFLVEVQMNAKRMLATMYIHTQPEFCPIITSRYYSLSNVLLRGGNNSKYLDEIQATYIRCMRNNNLELIGLRAPLVACNNQKSELFYKSSHILTFLLFPTTCMQCAHKIQAGHGTLFNDSSPIKLLPFNSISCFCNLN